MSFRCRRSRTCLLVLGAQAACARLPEDTRSVASERRASIVLGQATDAFPGVVQLRLQTTGGETFDHCTGTLISPRRVLTAAHCLPQSFRRDAETYVPRTGIQVFFGSDARAPGEVRNVLRQDMHANENAPTRVYPVDSYVGQHDTAILELETAAPSDIATLPITLDTLSDDELRDLPKLIVGFGATEVLDDENRQPDPQGQHIKRAGEPAPLMRYWSDDEDADFLGAFNGTWVAATDGVHAASCKGDSGGPLLVQRGGQWAVAAVISRGERYCDGPTFYAPLTASEEFLESFLPDPADTHVQP